MALTQFNDDVSLITLLDDEPNAMGGLSPSELKAEFDKAANKLKTFINTTLIPELNTALGAKVDSSTIMSFLNAKFNEWAEDVDPAEFLEQIGVMTSEEVTQMISDIFSGVTPQSITALLQGTGLAIVLSALKTALDGKSETSHTHNYASTVNGQPVVNNGVTITGEDVQVSPDDTTTLKAFVTTFNGFASQTESEIAAVDAKAEALKAKATTSADGLMSKEDKTKLNGIEAGANHYVLPAAAQNTKGGVYAYADGDTLYISTVL